MSKEKKKSHDDDCLDFKKLERELESAVEADKKYWRENDAKFRAVHQKVESYEEFRDIVMASHIKPLDKGDNFQNITFDVKWNSVANDKGKSDSSAADGVKKESFKIPKDNQEFVRDWRRYYKTTAEQYNYLKSIGGTTLAKIFRTDISLFGDILKALDSEFMDSDCDVVLDIVENLTKTNRFTLSVQFLNSAEKEARNSLFAKLKNSKGSENSEVNDNIDRLVKIYEIK
ncbi:hypothetical protein FSP39_024487 [Pinctada imbricata]|uniref:Coiled-coil domain-containing protein 103 n=1 Tax=Pinctada imbricata TaxID=66713 RepID=A0AA88XDY1_PINIB|nr:hypothetical protein FSP39_024487 [Pinctada imbricata]